MLFKKADDKFKEIGFTKIEDSKYAVVYDKIIKECEYTHRIAILHKSSGKHIIQSYDPEVTDRKNIGNICVGLTPVEMKLCIKKMKEKGWKIKAAGK